MISQIFLPNNHKFFTTYINEPPFSFEFKLGAVETYSVLEDKSGSFTSLGGDPETPLIYKYQDNGWTEFNFKIFGLNPYVNESYSSAAVYEIWVNGIKPYYHFHDRRYGTLFDTSIIVKCEKDKTTDFKFRLSLVEPYADPPKAKEYFYQGGQNTVYSSITAKFIPDPVIEESNEPIAIAQDAQLTLNRRHIVKAPSGKILQLSMPDHTPIKKGDWIELKNMDKGFFQINSGNAIDIVMNGLITRAKNGYIRCSKRGDFIRLECMETEPRIIFSDTNTIGNFSIL